MFDKMKELMEMKKQADQLKKELDAASVEVTEIRGIKIVVSGSQNFQKLDIDPSLLSVDQKNRLETELLKSLNLAIRKSQTIAAQKMKAMTGLNIPGL